MTIEDNTSYWLSFRFTQINKYITLNHQVSIYGTIKRKKIILQVLCHIILI